MQVFPLLLALRFPGNRNLGGGSATATPHIHCRSVTIFGGRVIAGLILRKILDCIGGYIYGERGARAYNGGLRQSPQRGSGAELMVRGAKPPEADSILACER